jgi:uncharacterized C2H2 Zn-finger protein
MECPKCHKTFAYHSGLTRHLNGSEKYKLKPCAGIRKEKTNNTYQPLECPRCNKTYTTRSNLTRHINGNVKYGLKPCEGTDKVATMVPQVELRAHDLQSQEAMKNPPDFVSTTIRNLFKNLIDSQMNNIPSKILESIYMNENHPEYWNVVMTNIDTKLMKVYDGNAWSYIYFNDWASSFTNYAQCLFSNQFIVPIDDANPMYNNRKENYRQLNKTLLGPMRQIIKKRHNIR